MEIDSNSNLIIVGLDKLKREVINVVNNNAVIFRQISNFNMLGICLISKANFEEGFITFGFENIRVWKVNQEKSIISGTNVYLGQTNRNVRYNSSIIVDMPNDTFALLADSNGFITTISLKELRMIQSLKVDSHSIDHIIQLRESAKDRRIITCTEAGVIKIINLESMDILE